MSGVGSLMGKELYEFGPFRVDPEKEVLLRAGEHVPLTPKTFQILLVLVRHGKEVVTKEDLMKAAWPDTFVEETNLTRNVFTLRKALGESEQNRYIITVPGRGYRFAEDVRLVPGQEVSIVSASRSKAQLQVKETKSWRWISVAVIILSAVAAWTFRLSLRRKPALTEKDTVVLADFANSTGDPVFDATLRQGMEVQLEQSPFLSLISEQRIQHALRLMGRPADARLSPDLAREVCERTGSAAVLEGSIAPLGSQYVLGLRATNCRAGGILDEEQAQAAKKEDVLRAVTQIASTFRTRVGESLAMVKQHDAPLAEATTPSLEALRAYSAAWKVVYATGSASAVPFVKRAIEIDPKFAMAYAFLGRLYGDIGESALSAESVSQAYQLRDRVTDREKFFITALYDRQVRGSLEKARETCELWAQAYPRDVGPHAFLSGGVSIGVGQYEKGVEEAQKSIGLDPDFAFGYSNLAANYGFLGRLPQAENTLQRASERRLEIPELLVERYDVAFLEGDRAGMERAAALSKGRSGAEDWIADKEAYGLAYSGHLQQARRMTRYAVELAQQAGERERLAQYETAEAVREALFGNAPEARRSGMAALALSKGRDVEYGAAIALARSEDSSLSQTLANDLERRLPEDTLVRFSYMPTLHALLALNDKKPLNAIEQLQIASRYELGSPAADSVGFVGALYPIYVRGEAYLAAKEGAEAAAEFQKILDHPGIVVSDPIGALAHLQLGRAYVLSGDKSKARSSYEDFLTLWKDADPGIPILKWAKAEYGRLHK
jgi:eukaryotic-like serine/threonine-protein kinase